MEEPRFSLKRFVFNDHMPESEGLRNEEWDEEQDEENETGAESREEQDRRIKQRSQGTILCRAYSWRTKDES